MAGWRSSRPGKMSKSLVERFPPAHATRHGDRVDSCSRHVLKALLFQEIRGKLFGRPAARVESGELFRSGIPFDGEEVATHAVIHGLDDAHNGVGGNGGVRGGASPRQNLRPGLRGQRLAGGDDTLPGDHHRACLRALKRIFSALHERIIRNEDHHHSHYQKNGISKHSGTSWP